MTAYDQEVAISMAKKHLVVNKVVHGDFISSRRVIVDEAKSKEMLRVLGVKSPLRDDWIVEFGLKATGGMERVISPSSILVRVDNFTGDVSLTGLSA